MLFWFFFTEKDHPLKTETFFQSDINGNISALTTSALDLIKRLQTGILQKMLLQYQLPQEFTIDSAKWNALKKNENVTNATFLMYNMYWN